VRGGDALRWTLLGVLAAAPLALGSVHPPAYVPLLVAGFLLGALALARRRGAQPRDASGLPGARLLLAFHALLLLQLLPLPESLLGLLSPGSLSFRRDVALVADGAWHPISVNPADTARGLAFAAGLSGLYVAVFWELGEPLWRRRLARVVVLTGGVMTLEALVQAPALGNRIYGLYHPDADWAVFGPYVNRNHFAGYMVMAIPLAFAFTAEAAAELRDAFRRRRLGWLALGEPEGSRSVRRAAEAVVLIVGLVAARSRGGLLGFLASLLALPLAFARTGRALASLSFVGVLMAAAVFVDLGPIRQGFESRGIYASRLALWGDVLPMTRAFPLFGCGFNAFGTAYPAQQTLLKGHWVGQAHNEYLQALVDTGVIGASLLVALLALALRAAWRGAPCSALDAGILGSLLALAAHNAVDFNWQIPANAATYVGLAALALRRERQRALTAPGAESRLAPAFSPKD
jgi:O-Antigen ligase